MSIVSFNLTKMLLSCWYGGYQCGANDFDLFTTYELGNCYVFNFNSNIGVNNKTLRKASQTGKMYGLSLELFNGVDG